MTEPSHAREALTALQGTWQQAGRASVLRMAHALGLEAAPEDYRVRSVRWIEDHVVVVAGDGPGRDDIGLLLFGRQPGVDGVAETEHLTIRYDASDISPWLARRLRRAAAVRLHSVTIERLADALTRDPELVALETPSDAPSEDQASGQAGEQDGELDRRPDPPRQQARPSDDERAQDRGPKARLMGIRKAAGKASVARLSRLFGLDTAPPPYCISSVAWIGDHIELGVDIGDDRQIRFTIDYRAPEAKGLVLTEQLVVQYEAKDLPDEVAQRVIKYGQSRLARLSIDDLAAMLLADEEFGKPGLPMPPTEHDRPASQLDTWAGRDAYADFFAGGEIARSQLDSVDISRFSRNVQHCDIECLFVNPHGQAEVVNMVEFPWLDRVRNIGVPRDELVIPAEPEGDGEDGMVSTDLDETDVIMGNPDKLRDALEYVTSLPNPSRKPLFVANTCVPTVTGEDVEQIVKEFRTKTDFPILYLTVTPKSMVDVLGGLLTTTRLEAEAAAGEPDPDLVNLVGFSDSRAVRELGAVLERFGVRVGTMLLPALTVSILEELPKASVNVFFPTSLWAHLYEQVKEGSRIRAVTPAAPFGWAGTRAWVKAVVEAVGKGEGFDERWDAYATEHGAEWKRVTARAAGRTLGMVVRAEETHYLTDPSETWGIPLLDMASEAGFGVEIILSAPDDKIGRRLAERLGPHLPKDTPCSLAFFDSFDKLRQTLEGATCEAILTNHFFDWRVGEAGKSRYTLQFFEMGVPGAARTIERLTGACRTSFFRRYRRYLARTAEGLRDLPSESGT